MKVRFLRDFDWNPEKYGGRLTVAYKRGTEMHVPRPCAAKAIKAGAAEAIEVEDGTGRPE